MTNTFADADVAAMLRLAGEVSELTPEVHARRDHILRGLLSLVGGCWAVCSEIDPREGNDSGWAVPNSVTCAGHLSPDERATVERYVTGRLAALDPCVPELLRQPGPVATVRRVDVADRSWFRSDHFNHVRRPLGFGESLYAVLTTPDRRRLKLSLHRELSDDPYTERHVHLVQCFNENLASLYTVTPRPSALDERLATLAPRLQKVLDRLLRGDSEKQAAYGLGLSPHTVHQYVKTLYRDLGANSRGELLAMFIR
jgi:DNA-binding CsgD family transcriptional regulator